jgi:hypothetical protein
MLRTVLEVFFMGQIIVEKLDEEIKIKLKEISEKLNLEFKNGKQTEEWKAIDQAVDTVKGDYQQALDAVQGLFRSTGNLACVAKESGLPLLASKCSSLKPTVEKVKEKIVASKR